MGSIFNKPSAKSTKLLLVAISMLFLPSSMIHLTKAKKLTFIDIILLDIPFRIRIFHNHILQLGLLEILFGRLLICPMLHRVLLHGFELVRVSTIGVGVDIKEFVRLFTDFEKVAWWISTISLIISASSSQLN